MTGQAAFTLRGRNPDVLTCIANLSNDEVFTPPEFASRMLDTLEAAWAQDHGGANLWADKSVTFLDPCTKSGVFLREITSRLTRGLAREMPNLEKRVDHILTKQVFGIGITQITSLLARRSVYCSRHANGKHSIARGFASEAGNIWFERLQHTWTDTKCEYCGAPRAIFDREDGLETHAYAFIHANNIKTRLVELFGGDMQFDVIIGNPPYQMTGGGGGSNDSSIYHLFVEQAMRLDAHYLSMVIPSRWVAGGRGMDEFRKTMLTDRHISHLVDYTKMSTAFPGVDFEGALDISYGVGNIRGMRSTRYIKVRNATRQSHAILVRTMSSFETNVQSEFSNGCRLSSSRRWRQWSARIPHLAWQLTSPTTRTSRFATRSPSISQIADGG